MNEPEASEAGSTPPPAGGPGGPNGFVRFIVVLLLLLAVGGFGCATLCGAVFTLGSLDASGYEAGMLAISVPSLLIGGVLTWLCARQLRRYLARRRS